MGKKYRGNVPNNMTNMMKQAQKLQKQIEETQTKIEETEFVASSGGGAVEIKANGKKEILSVKIDEDIIKDGDSEMIEDMILVAVNDVLTKVSEETESQMSKLTGGINIPGF
ncbi:MAG: YbaB/EbfC family nucleoid-associated protein [Finegoldia sp.]|nr:YbaB/EbfC family nucleoid-associated protein [Finegoldia sp.]